MAKIKTITGDFTGKIGPVVLVNGKTGKYIRSLPNRTDKKSEGQIKQRNKLQIVNAFLKPIKDFLQIGYLERNENQYAYHAATSNLMRNGFDEGNSENLAYQKVQVCKGSLAPAHEPTVSVSDHVIVFRWEDNDSIPCSKTTDKLVFLLYSPEQQISLGGICETKRSEKYHLYLVDNKLTGKFLAYIAFINKHENRISNSTFLGEIELQKHVEDKE
jgi:hypothetical protein